MMRKKILFVFGTRPEAIKMAPVIKLAKRRKKSLNPIVCVTAQHRHLLDQALGEFGVVPDIDLNLMKDDQTLYDIISSVIYGMREVYRKVRPHLVLLQGDTSTVFAAALAAYYENIDIAHIEAGLRSQDTKNPFPEEINRRFVSLVAKYNFCPTPLSKKNLLSEGVDEKNVYITGNTIIDAVKMVLSDIGTRQLDIKGISKKFFDKTFVLITGHRRENFGKGLEDICSAIKYLAAKHGGVNWLWIAHLNPNARKAAFGTLSGMPNVKLVEPMPYSEFVYLMSRAEFIISDSGGIQEEAPYLRKRVLVTRIRTERPEAVKCGASVLVGTDSRRIIDNADRILKRGGALKTIKNPFGDGMAADRIIDVIINGRCREYRLIK